MKKSWCKICSRLTSCAKLSAFTGNKYLLYTDLRRDPSCTPPGQKGCGSRPPECLVT